MMTSGLRPAVFLDRDGTINVEKDYLIEPAEFEFIPGVVRALKRLQDAGYLLVVVTNQSGVARGYFDLNDVEKIHLHMKSLLATAGVQLAGIYICPHHPTAGGEEFRKDCDCRKGKPGMLLRAAVELGIDLHKSYMIGDKESDFLAGKAAGCCSLLVRTGYGDTCSKSTEGNGVLAVADLPEAANVILEGETP